MPEDIAFKSLRESLELPVAPGKMELDVSDFGKLGRAEQEHIALNAVLAYYEKFRSLPQINDEKDAQSFLALAEECLLANRKHEGQKGSITVPALENEVFLNIARFARAQISPYTSMLGGFVTQEVIKLTGKYMPLRQWLHIDSFEALPGTSVDRTLSGSQYDYLTAIFGKEVQESMLNSR